MTKVHVKNNRWAAGSFPNTPEGEEVFTITEDRFNTAMALFDDVNGKLSTFIDWDTDHWDSSMAEAEVLLTWNMPMENLKQVAPKLKWIHCIGAGVEHMLPLDWLPDDVVLTNNKGVHAAKAGEFGLMAVLMLHSHITHNNGHSNVHILQIFSEALKMQPEQISTGFGDHGSTALDTWIWP